MNGGTQNGVRASNTNGRTGSKPMDTFRFSGRTFSMVTIGLPLLGAAACVTLSVVYNLEGSTRSHCGPRVKNYLPSISSAVGDYTPQRYIWRTCIGLHSAPRFLIGMLFLKYYLSLTVSCREGFYRALVFAAFTFYNIENIGLVGLSFVSSTENFNLHQNNFIAFIVSSLFHMLITCVLMHWGHKVKGMTDRVATANYWSKRLFLANGLAFACSMYCYFRHLSYCESGMYTLFSLLEYITVATNIAFHGAGLLMIFGHGSLNYDIPRDIHSKTQ